MKKYLIPVAVLLLLGGVLFIHYVAAAPAKAAAFDLEAINGITVEKTTEAELLSRSAFQTMDHDCFEADCVYHTERENKLLSTFHMAPRVLLSTSVRVRFGTVTKVSVIVYKAGLLPVSVMQTSDLPAGCAGDPCAELIRVPSKAVMGNRILFSTGSGLRNRMPDAFEPMCLSRLRGCNTYQELVPLAKGLHLEAGAH
ncbi:MAG TPA: hypothetical protein VGK24_17180 [Candidatus Angelobacter sp.]|jgi:hypothetical protein